MMRREFVVVVPGEPRGAGRPRFGRGRDGAPRAFTAKADRDYHARITEAWRADACPTLPAGPWRCDLAAYMARPKDHHRADGSLSAKGLRELYPSRKPDADNILKVIDALVACRAVPDDRYLVDAVVVKRWAPEDEGPALVIQVASV
jgi:Holliday junction resolvase RusA-like endonuclease